MSPLRLAEAQLRAKSHRSYGAYIDNMLVDCLQSCSTTAVGSEDLRG